MNKKIHFLTENEVLLMHKDQIKRYGGSQGIRDKGLLISAIKNPQASFSKKFLYKDIFEMASSYAYSIIKNHPFIDGNKRTGMASLIVFLRYNSYELFFKKNEIYKIGIAIAKSEISQEKLAILLRKKTNI